MVHACPIFGTWKLIAHKIHGVGLHKRHGNEEKSNNSDGSVRLELLEVNNITQTSIKKAHLVVAQHD